MTVYQVEEELMGLVISLLGQLPFSQAYPAIVALDKLEPLEVAGAPKIIVEE